MKKIFILTFLVSITSISNAYAYCSTKNCVVRFSDIRLKENTVQIGSSLEKVSQLKGVTFEWKSPRETDIEHLPQRKDIGVIAQDVEKVFPELVHNIKVTDKNGAEIILKKVNYAGLVGVLIEAVKELKQENIELREQLAITI
ncbi:tail fiber domain-containing protein [Spartinivicinus ruber]|uniref:tail fiber domain-containing protein n=1 Tax=Spartinivicinus ruber TaxID=2683272 RepID=UPI0013D5EE8E|nr:tail fiber domain-containing protein [Spartinivicinus ruber]